MQIILGKEGRKGLGLLVLQSPLILGHKPIQKEWWGISNVYWRFGALHLQGILGVFHYRKYMVKTVSFTPMSSRFIISFLNCACGWCASCNGNFFLKLACTSKPYICDHYFHKFWSLDV